MRWLLLTLGLIIGMAQSQQPQQTPEIPAKKESNSPLKGDEKSTTKTKNAEGSVASVPELHPESSTNKAQQHAHQGGDETSEFWTVNGRRLKVTDSLLVVFTFLLFVATVLLWWSTNRLVRGAEDTAERQLRAYVTVKSIREEPQLSVKDGLVLTWQFQVIWQNTGQTPANEFMNAIAAQYFKPKIPENFDFPLAPKLQHIIGPHGEVDSSWATIDPGHLREFVLSRGCSGEIYLWGRCTYMDVFEKTPDREFRYCVKMSLTGDPYDLEGWRSKGMRPFQFDGFHKHNSSNCS